MDMGIVMREVSIEGTKQKDKFCNSRDDMMKSKIIMVQ